VGAGPVGPRRRELIAGSQERQAFADDEMFLPKKPSAAAIETFIAAQHHQPFSYVEVGASRGRAPAGYNVDHNRVLLGYGEETFARAAACLRSWRMFDLGWCRVYPAAATLEVGATVAVVVSHFGFWSLNACRIVYLLEERGALQRCGFAYGTLPEHAEVGEERFSVEWDAQDGSVWYDLYAFSRPRRLMTRLGYPLGRMLQRRFARDSKAAMVRAVAAGRA
jgi:uncharacterized protein (UPF0548 family)